MNGEREPEGTPKKLKGRQSQPKGGQGLPKTSKASPKGSQREAQRAQSHPKGGQRHPKNTPGPNYMNKLPINRPSGRYVKLYCNLVARDTKQ